MKIALKSNGEVTADGGLIDALAALDAVPKSGEGQRGALGAALNRRAEAERMAIVTWLRHRADDLDEKNASNFAIHYRTLAYAIERGEHARPDPDERRGETGAAEATHGAQLVAAIRHHINNDMEQFDRWRMKDTFGNTVYIHLSYIPTAPEEAHLDLDASSPDER